MTTAAAFSRQWRQPPIALVETPRHQPAVPEYAAGSLQVIKARHEHRDRTAAVGRSVPSEFRCVLPRLKHEQHGRTTVKEVAPGVRRRVICPVLLYLWCYRRGILGSSLKLQDERYMPSVGMLEHESRVRSNGAKDIRKVPAFANAVPIPPLPSVRRECLHKVPNHARPAGMRQQRNELIYAVGM